MFIRNRFRFPFFHYLFHEKNVSLQRSSKISELMREDSPDLQTVCEDEYDEKDTIEYLLRYLSEKQHLTQFDVDEELVFFPELYGICPPFRHHCLNLRENRILLKRVKNYIRRTTRPGKRMPMLSHVHEYNFVEIYLDNLKLENPLPKKIFSCKNLRILSLKGNHLRTLPADVGRLKNLQELYLTNNKLKSNSLPYTLTFCYKLHTLFLDNNRINMLPGFLLKMENLTKLRRQSNKISFRKKFKLQRIPPESNYRIDRITSYDEKSTASRYEITSLQNLAAKVIAASKVDYFSIEYFPTMVQDVISRYYSNCSICDNCTTPDFEDDGWYVYNSCYGYLGNYWTIFLYKACNENCANQLYEASYKLEQSSLVKSNDEYNEVVSKSQDICRKTKKKKRKKSCLNQCCPKKCCCCVIS